MLWENALTSLVSDLGSAAIMGALSGGGGGGGSGTNSATATATNDVAVNPEIYNLIDTSGLGAAQTETVSELRNLKKDVATGFQTVAAALVLAAVLMRK